MSNKGMLKIFIKCVDLLYWLSDKTHLSYETINVSLFCIILPIITIISIILNIIYYV